MNVCTVCFGPPSPHLKTYQRVKFENDFSKGKGRVLAERTGIGRDAKKNKKIQGESY